jgi:glycosyltransferase involved in cell wall biosynthesis
VELSSFSSGTSHVPDHALQGSLQGSVVEIVDTSFPAAPRQVSVVIPAYNEGPHVADQVRDVDAVMQKSGWTYEIIVVDDGSKDDTSANAAKTPARVLRRARNQGYGAALKLGIRHAQYDWILITDADGTYPVAAIPEILARAEMNDMVVGARVGSRGQHSVGASSRQVVPQEAGELPGRA